MPVKMLLPTEDTRTNRFGGQAITMVTHCYKQALSMEKRNHEMEETHCRSTKQLEEEAHMGV